MEEILINSLKSLLAGRVNELLGETEYPRPPIEFGDYRGGSAVVPVIALSTCERSEFEPFLFPGDDDGIAAFGTAALNITGSYFSEYEIDGKPYYEDWVSRELAERIQNKREFTVKTHRGLFNARVRTKVQIKMKVTIQPHYRFSSMKPGI